MAEEITVEKKLKSNVFVDQTLDYSVVEGTTEGEKIKTKKDVSSWVNAGAGNDTITGLGKYDMLAGNEGDDVINASKAKGSVEIYGGENNDNLTGSKYADYLAGGTGDDVIRGGKGNDTLRGGTPGVDNEEDTGKDTFVFYKGDGVDVIRDATSEDVIEFADRKSFAGLTFEQGKDAEGNLTADLVIKDKYNNITVQNYFVEDKENEGAWKVSENAVNQFALKNGTYTLEWRTSNVTGASNMYNIVEGSNDAETIAPSVGISNWVNANAGEDIIKGINQGDMLAGNLGSNTINASKAKGNVEIFGGLDNDTITGSKYNDFITGGTGNDVIRGGKGNDTLRGGTPGVDNEQNTGKDTFVFYKGDGVDVIRDATSEDVIEFADRKSFAGLTFEQGKDAEGNLTADLVIKDKYNNITVQNYFVEDKENEGAWKVSENAVNQFALKNGTYTLEWRTSNVTGASNMYNIVEGSNDAETIAPSVGISNWVNANAGEDIIKGINQGDMLAGNLGSNTINASKAKGNVEIFGGLDNDTITGSKYNDFITGGTGNDVIRGGKGNDTLRGGTPGVDNEQNTGKDTFVFYKGDGKDVIKGIDGDDVIQLANVKKGGFTQSLDGDDLVISYNGGKDSITINNYLSDLDNIPDFSIETKDGTIYKAANIDELKGWVSAWTSATGEKDFATALDNATSDETAILAAIFEQYNFQEVPQA